MLFLDISSDSQMGGRKLNIKQIQNNIIGTLWKLYATSFSSNINIWLYFKLKYLPCQTNICSFDLIDFNGRHELFVSVYDRLWTITLVRLCSIPFVHEFFRDCRGNIIGGLKRLLTWREKDPRRRIILAPYVFCIQFTCKTLYLSLALGSSLQWGRN